MGKSKEWITCGRTVTHKKTGKKGKLLKFTATSWKGSKKYQVQWEDGLTTWVFRRDIAY